SSRFGSPAVWPMLVRRIATVTICAPLSSTAARVSSKSRYLPVPISSRDVNSRWPMFRVSEGALMSRFRSAAADGHDDLEAVAGRERLGVVPAARHDLAVALDRDPSAREPEFGEQRGDGAGRRQGPRIAVDDDGFHRGIVACAPVAPFRSGAPRVPPGLSRAP